MQDQSKWTLTRKAYYYTKLHLAKKKYNKLNADYNGSKEHQSKLINLSKKIIKYNKKLKDISDYQANNIKEKLERNFDKINKEKMGEENIIDKLKRYNNFDKLEHYEDESKDRNNEKEEFETRRDSHIYRTTN